MNKDKFLQQKLSNMIEWIKKDNLLTNDNELLNKLISFQSDRNGMLNFLTAMCNYANSNNEIPDNIMTVFFDRNAIDRKTFNDEQYNKFKKYLKCFISVSRSA